MSDLIVKIQPITDLRPHSNADNLEIVIIGGWQVCAKKSEFSIGEEVLFIPVDAMIPYSLSDSWGISSYLRGVDKRNVAGSQYEKAARVRAIKLRGEPSLGVVIPNTENLEVGVDLKEHFGIYKYEEPEKPTGGGAGRQSRNSPFWHKYTNVENLRNYPSIFMNSEPVIISEKLHGMNHFCGLALVQGEENRNKEFIISSHEHQRVIGEGGNFEAPIHLYRLEEMVNAIYDEVFTENQESFISIYAFGEILGSQDLMYNCKSGQLDYRCFDIAINGKYIPYDEMIRYSSSFDIPLVPLLYNGPYSEQLVWDLTKGKSVVEGSNNIKEGVVVRANPERTDPRIGRVILKLLSDDYLTRKGKTTEFH